MESTSPQVKSFITFAYEYQQRPTEKNLTQLQRQIQILSVISDLSVFEPSCMEALEFYVCLERLLINAEHKSSLMWKILTLLLHISHSEKVRVALRDDIQLMPILTELLIAVHHLKDKNLKVLQLMQEISYGIEIDRFEAWLMRLLPHLVSMAVEGSMTDESLYLDIAIIVNVCRKSVPATSCLRNTHDHKALVKMMVDFKSADAQLRLISMELMLLLNLDFKKHHKILLPDAVDTLLDAAQDGLIRQSSQLLRLSVDVIKDVSSEACLQEVLRSYENYPDRIQALLGHLNSETSPSLANILFQLFNHIITLELPQLSPLLHDTFQKALTWINNRICGVSAITLVQSILSVGGQSFVSPHVDDLLTHIKDVLQIEDTDFDAEKDIGIVAALLCLLETLCSLDPTMHFKLSMMLSPSIFSTLLQALLNSSSPNQSTISESSPTQEDTVLKLKIGGFASTSNLKSEVVVRILTMVKMLGAQKAEFVLEYSQMINSKAVMEHIIRCDRSTKPEVVVRVATLLSEGTVPNESIHILIEAKQDANRLLELEATSQEKNSFGRSYLTHSPTNPETDERIEKIITTLRKSTEHGEDEGGAVSAVMDLYEYKIAARFYTEKMLQNALEAADTRIRQTNIALMQARAESCRVQSLLKMWEERVHEERKGKENWQNKVKIIENDSKQMREKLVKEKTAISRQVAELRKDLNSLNNDLQGKEEEIKKLNKALADANAEVRNQNKIIKEEQDNGKKVREQVQKLEDDQRKRKREFEDLTKESQKLEKQQVQLKKENSEQELLIRSHEQSLTEKEAQIEEMTKNYMALKRIQDMIHNMSAATPKV
ncbi:protein CIP2A homolog [Oratosquilla oratoria]|uniref:protein CIP2A homolog n=1 Tax=Oratosquilla oratoria TaxID=337810 RepID=UPI003F772702